MSCHIPGNISTYNEETAPLIDKLKQSYVPIDVKAAFNQLLEHLHNDELEACIDAGEELLKKRIPDTTCTRVHTLIASCLEDPDEMEEHYEKALNLWTLLNAEHANTRIEPWLREVRTQLDALRDAIQEERSDEITPELTMSAIAIVESAPTFGPSSTSSPDTSPARSSASSAASSALSATTNSRLSGAIASPGQQTLRLHDHLDMSPADILKLAWDPNRTIRGRTASSKTLPSRPFKRRASSTSQSTRGSTLPESASSESASSESASREIPSTPPPSTPSKTLPPTQASVTSVRNSANVRPHRQHRNIATSEIKAGQIEP